MAAGGYGLQFQPGVPQNGDRNGNGQRGRLQEPVRVLSTRLPKFFGSQSIAPAPLLQSQGGMGQPAARGNVVAQALAQLAGLPPSMQDPQRPPGGGYAGGLGIGGGGLGAGLGTLEPMGGGVDWSNPPRYEGQGPFKPVGLPPLPSGYGLPPPYSPPPPVVRPGVLPVLTPLPQGPEPSPGAQPEPDWGNWLRRHHELNNRPASQFGPDNGGDLISQLAGRMFR